MPSFFRLTIALAAACCTPASAQTAYDELPAWPVQDTRPLSVRGPAQAPSSGAPSPSTAMDVPPAIVDGAVRQATFYGTLDEPDVLAAPSLEARGLLYEPSPSDAGRTESLSAGSPAAESATIAAAPEGAPPTTATTDSGRALGPRPLKQSITSGPRRPFAEFGLEQFSSETLTTVGASLAVVIGLLMLLAWVWRRAAPRSSRPLPDDVVSVIGRVPLAGRQVAQLIKIGGKLVLVCVTPEGAKPLTEITDPEEVARVLGLCEQHNPHSASAAFREVFADLTREPASGFLGDEASPIDRQRLADAYANTPGGRAYA